MHSVLQLFALEEDDEDGLVNQIALNDRGGVRERGRESRTNGGGIFDGLVDVRLFQVDVASTDAPQHAFERVHLLPVDHPRDETEREDRRRTGTGDEGERRSLPEFHS